MKHRDELAKNYEHLWIDFPRPLGSSLLTAERRKEFAHKGRKSWTQWLHPFRSVGDEHYDKSKIMHGGFYPEPGHYVRIKPGTRTPRGAYTLSDAKDHSGVIGIVQYGSKHGWFYNDPTKFLVQFIDVDSLWGEDKFGTSSQRWFKVTDEGRGNDVSGLAKLAATVFVIGVVACVAPILAATTFFGGSAATGGSFLHGWGSFVTWMEGIKISGGGGAAFWTGLGKAFGFHGGVHAVIGGHSMFLWQATVATWGGSLFLLYKGVGKVKSHESSGFLGALKSGAKYLAKKFVGLGKWVWGLSLKTITFNSKYYQNYYGVGMAQFAAQNHLWV